VASGLVARSHSPRGRLSGAGARRAWRLREDLPWPARFDGAFCFGNSLGYLDDQGNEAFLNAVVAVLKPGSRLVPAPIVLENKLVWTRTRGKSPVR
jgi:SAM-dependent methyltransferase